MHFEAFLDGSWSRNWSSQKVAITGGAAGNSFTLDDLTYTPLAGVVPEPSTLSVLIAGIAALLLFRSKRNSCGYAPGAVRLILYT